MAFTQWVQAPVTTDVAAVDGYNVCANKNTNLTFLGGRIQANPLLGSNMITNNLFGNTYGGVTFQDAYLNATSPFWTLNNSWPVNLRNVQLVDLNNNYTVVNQIQLPTGGKFGLGITPVGQQTMGAATAGSSYTSNEQNMLQTLWNVVRAFGL